VVTPAARREAALHLQAAFEMGERRECRVLGADRTSVGYRATRPDDGPSRERLKALAEERRRFGYRRLHVLLRREGRLVNKKRVQRIYGEERLTVRRRADRLVAAGTRQFRRASVRADVAAPCKSADEEVSAVRRRRGSLRRRVSNGTAKRSVY